MTINRSLAVLVLALFATAASAPVSPATQLRNLVSNPSLEEADIPEHWQFLNVWGAPGHFAIDHSIAHSGKRSFRITSKNSTQSWLCSERVPVAPGETIEASAWVRFKDLPPAHVTSEGLNAGVILVANFFNGDGRTEQFRDFDHIDGPGGAGSWHELKGSLKVPSKAAMLRLRIGFRDASGTCWIDDVALRASRNLVVRSNLEYPRLTPEMGGIPILVINRSGQTGQAVVRAKLGKIEASAPVTLRGQLTQKILIPLAISTRGQMPLEVSLLESQSAQPVFTEMAHVLVPPAMVLSPAIPTHWAVEDGPPRVEADVDLAISKAQRENSILRVELIDKDNQLLTSASSSDQNPLEDGFNRFYLRSPAIPLGDYKLVARLLPKNATAQTAAITAEQPFVVIPRELSRVTLNSNGYLVYRHKAIFPLGIFNGPAKVKQMGEAGFTVNHAYNACNVAPGERPDDEAAKKFLDDTEKNGMMALFLIPRGLAFSGDWEGFRRRIRMFKNHPALLAWDEEEGLARGDMDMKALATMRRILREEDPNHPFMVGDSRDVITNVKDRSNFFPLRYMDLGMWWWYPIPAGASRANMLEGDELTRATELTPPSFLTRRNTNKPLWVGVQAYKKPNKTGRYPTPDEYRAQAYLSIIYGAKGLMWYGGSVAGGIFLDPKAGHWDDLKKLVRELHDRADVFMAPSDSPPTVTPADAPISAAVKHPTGRRVLLSVNRSTREVDAVIKTSDGNVIRHHYKPYETYVTQWDAP